jgi:hypothetical protein
MTTIDRERRRKYTDSEIEHACEKLRFVMKNTRPQTVHVIERVIDIFVEKIAEEEKAQKA